MTKEEVLEKWGVPTKVGPDGHVRLVDYMGNDAAVVQAARTSYGAGTKTVNEDRGLIRYLLRHRHTTPFEMVELKFHVRVPMDTWRQWIRHRTASVNEYSTRYSVAIDSRAVTESDEWRLQSSNNKQGSAGMVAGRGIITTENGTELDSAGIACLLTLRERELHDLGQAVYQERLDFGVAREQARKDLPLSTYTEAYWKMDLHNLMHFLRLRLHPHAQQEIREFAEVMYQMLKDVVPLCCEAFEDYGQGGQYFTREEMNALKAMLSGRGPSECIQVIDADDDWHMPLMPGEWGTEDRKAFLTEHIGTQHERQEFWSKIT